ncbi:unnamed protein product [Parnassius mnemosyne]|uniref:Uncharacterized protein n=1 Tax=Parnassius mnemosyne TaxID=213953 RepID=A0AAV1M9S0_9NEOP
MSSNKKNTNLPSGICSKCSKFLKPPNDKKTSVTCDSCKILLCGECHGLSPTEVRVLELKTVARIMTFLCSDCKSAMTQLPMIMKKLNELSEEVKQLRMRQSMLATESAIQEMTERANRANNLIIYDVPESTSDIVDKRKEDGVGECVAIINTITNKVNCNGIKVFRLGAPKKHAGAKPRPLKAILHTKSDALEVLRHRNKLSEPSNITSDLTPLQREYLKYLREKLNKRINDGETDITIKYIRGHPTIVKTNAQNN